MSILEDVLKATTPEEKPEDTKDEKPEDAKDDQAEEKKDDEEPAAKKPNQKPYGDQFVGMFGQRKKT